MELKLRSVLARRAETPAAVRREQDAAGLRAEMRQFEGRMAARLQGCENSVVEVHQAATDLKGQLAAMNAQFAAAGEGQRAIFEGLLEVAEARIGERVGRDIEAANERVGRLEQGLEATEARVAERVGRDIEAANERIGRLEQGLEATEARVAERVGRDIEAAGERIGRLEQGLEAAREHTTTLHESMSEDFLAFEQSLKSQATAIESVRTAMSQTDDLVERVVEALESLQTVVLEPREDPAAAMN
jgi:predicted  nucleic acid-binding Zn-ribbon protein